MPSVEPPKLDNPRRLSGTDRDEYAEYVHHLYTNDCMAVREIARFTGRSYGLIHNLLHEHGTKMRPEGHQLGVPMHTKREGTAETIEILEKKGNGRYGPIS